MEPLAVSVSDSKYPRVVVRTRRQPRGVGCGAQPPVRVIGIPVLVGLPRRADVRVHYEGAVAGRIVIEVRGDRVSAAGIRAGRGVLPHAGLVGQAQTVVGVRRERSSLQHLTEMVAWSL